MRQAIAAALGAAFLLVAAAPPAAGQAACGPRTEVLAQLAARHGERPGGAGLLADGRVLELLVAASGSWTLLVTTADGLSCLVAAGTAWQTAAPLPPAPPGRGS